MHQNDYLHSVSLMRICCSCWVVCSLIKSTFFDLVSSKMKCQTMKSIIGLLILLCLIGVHTVICEQFLRTIQTIGNKFGSQMLNIGYEKTCFTKISENFQKHRSDIKQIDATQLMEDMRLDLINMFNWKKTAVERIAIESEKLASEHSHDKTINYSEYYNMKRIYDSRFKMPDSEDISAFKDIPLSPHPNFEDSLVNLKNSAVHVPINVYEKASDILNDIKWSESLTETFRNNLLYDPSLSWQFFGSSKGFVRIYPATKWKVPYDSNSKSRTPDLYDCRIRQWYIQAAASPKDIVILLDISGSMTGLRRNIALNVVFNILDTLTDDDYVVVLKFTNEIKYLSPCMNQMVQATKRNIREIKERFDILKTSDVANFTNALIEGFTVLKNFSRQHKGAQCNQAIMLITDGAPETYEPIFRRYNPDASIRLFTYVIGREVTQIHEVYWMACNNRGYYAQVANLAEVREQVQQYIPVMSRPLVLSAKRTFSWTPVYSHVSEIQLTDWIWEERVKALKTKILQQSQVLIEQGVDIENIEDDKKENDTDEEIEEIVEEDLSMLPSVVNPRLFNIELEMAKLPSRKKKIQLMTTLSTPVFDHRKYINITKKVLVKNVYKDSTPETIRVAELLGVAGIDVPIREIEKMTLPYKLGVNGYSFMLTNNGKVLYHPDFRPIFQDMLKPFYSSVDINELEMANITSEPRSNDIDLKTIRSDMINGSTGSKKVSIKSFIDSMKRPVSRVQHYAYGKIDHTPFSFAIVLPEQYGSYRFVAQVDLRAKSKAENYTRFFNGNNWRVHPDWVYCDYLHKLSGVVPRTAEDSILQFLNFELAANQFKWKTSSINPQAHENVTCEKELIQSLVFDAIATHSFEECSEFSRKFNRKDERSIEIVNAFVSTRSGLTRFTNSNFNAELQNKSDNEFSKSIDEVYYRRAVDFYYTDNKAFVYSVPFDAALKENEFVVTSSHAIFAGNGKMSAPVAVVGVQYNYSSFYSSFFKTAEQFKLNCISDEIDCFVLDNNGFIIISETYKHAGMFFGEINNDILQDMVQVGVYRKIHYYDYQAICIDVINTSSSSFSLLSPLYYMKNALLWLGSKLVLFYATLFYNSWLGESVLPVKMNYEDIEYETDMYEIRFNKSRPKPCDKEFDLFELTSFANQTLQYSHTCPHDTTCTRNYFVQHIPHSNLIMLILLKTCNCFTTSSKLESKEILYSNSELCKILKEETFRKRPETCFNFHSEESEIKLCGKASKMTAVSLMLLILSTALSAAIV